MIDKNGKPYPKVNSVENQGAEVQQRNIAQKHAQGAQEANMGKINMQPPQGFYPSFYVPPLDSQAGYFLPPDFQS